MRRIWRGRRSVCLFERRDFSSVNFKRVSPLAAYSSTKRNVGYVTLKGAAESSREGRIRSSYQGVLFPQREGRKKGEVRFSHTRARTHDKARATAVVRSGGRIAPIAVHIVFLAARARRRGRRVRSRAEPSGAELPISWDPRGVVSSR